MLNAQQEKQYQLALSRAVAENLVCADTGHNSELHARTWQVFRQDGSHSYTVYQQDGSCNLHCACTAGQNGVYCKHRALVRAHLILGVGGVAKMIKFLREWAKTGTAN